MNELLLIIFMVIIVNLLGAYGLINFSIFSTLYREACLKWGMGHIYLSARRSFLMRWVPLAFLFGATFCGAMSRGLYQDNLISITIWYRASIEIITTAIVISIIMARIYLLPVPSLTKYSRRRTYYPEEDQNKTQNLIIEILLLGYLPGAIISIIIVNMGWWPFSK